MESEEEQKWRNEADNAQQDMVAMKVCRFTLYSMQYLPPLFVFRASDARKEGEPGTL